MNNSWHCDANAVIHTSPERSPAERIEIAIAGLWKASFRFSLH
jgi:hypothetical protein